MLPYDLKHYELIDQFKGTHMYDDGQFPSFESLVVNW